MTCSVMVRSSRPASWWANVVCIANIVLLLLIYIVAMIPNGKMRSVHTYCFEFTSGRSDDCCASAYTCIISLQVTFKDVKEATKIRPVVGTSRLMVANV